MHDSPPTPQPDKGEPQPPGSPLAVANGCTCPRIDNGHGVGARGTSGPKAEYWINAACPVHGVSGLRGQP